MSAILSCRSLQSTNVAFVSDTLITRNVKSMTSEEQLIHLPLSSIPVSGPSVISMPAEGIKTERLTQKAQYIDERIIFLWAGRELDAKIVARHLYLNRDKILADRSANVVQRIIMQDYSADDFPQSSFIFSTVREIDGKSCIETQGFRTESEDWRGHRISFGGTGAILLQGTILPFEMTTMNEAPTETTNLVLELIGNAIVSQMAIEEFPYFRTGGWYEISVATHTGFKQIPYSVNLFSAKGENLCYHGSTRAFYRRNALFIVSHNAQWLIGDDQAEFNFWLAKGVELSASQVCDPKLKLSLFPGYSESRYSIDIVINYNEQAHTIIYNDGDIFEIRKSNTFLGDHVDARTGLSSLISEERISLIRSRVFR